MEGDPELGRPSSMRGEAVSVLLVDPAPSAPKAVPGMGGGRLTTVVVEGMST